MRRPMSMRDNEGTPPTWVSNVSYNAASQITLMNSPTGVLEGRSYNSLGQATQITAPGMSMSYNYSPTQRKNHRPAENCRQIGGAVTL
ncbi:MAG: hypothetical protein M3Y07_02545 [Acidobacteriota bacterium]|nr:hypothetical protein [Acidobacteriota bacterium]